MNDVARGYSAADPGPSRSTADMLESIWRLRSWTLRTAAWAAAIRRREEPVSRALLTLPDAERFAGLAMDRASGPETIHVVHRLDSASASTAGTWSDFIDSIATTPGSSGYPVGVALVRPGDPRGIGLPGIVEGVQPAGIVIVIPSGPTTRLAIPASLHEGLLTWRVEETSSTSISWSPSESPREAETSLRAAILKAEVLLDDLGHRPLSTPSRDRMEDSIRDVLGGRWPTTMTGARRTLLSRAVPIAWMCEAAINDESPIISTGDAAVRRDALLDLDRIARRAIEAAASWPRVLVDRRADRAD